MEKTAIAESKALDVIKNRLTEIESYFNSSLGAIIQKLDVINGSQPTEGNMCCPPKGASGKIAEIGFVIDALEEKKVFIDYIYNQLDRLA